MRRIRSRRLRTTWNIVKVAVLLMIAGSLGWVAAILYGVAKGVPSPGDITVYRPSEATRIYSSEGALLAEVYEENREYIPITEIPKQLQDATVAVEDRRFYQHSGVDPRGILRALYENFRQGRRAQGGSTLTQQLACNIYLTRRRTFSRKIQEVLLAREIERRLSKQEILELYLNQSYYGSGAYGVKAAARTYFGKKPSQLTLAECALLAGLPKKPSGWSPYENEKAAIGRRNVVLKLMAEQGYITEEEYRRASSEKPHLIGRRYGRARVKKAPHFVDYVVNQLVDRWGPDEVYRGGLRVYTTLNLEIQEAAEKALKRHVERARREGKRVGQGAVVALDPHTGYIKAMVGSLDYHDKDHGGQFNRAVQARRQPGSAFKVFVYTAAIDSGYSPNYVLMDTPISFPDGNKRWAPKNYDGRFRGPVTIRYAVEKSINIPAIRMTQMVGVDKVIAYAQRMGIRSPLGRDLSLAIGTSVVSPLELASAYGTLAADGMHADPIAVLRVVGRNERVLEDNRPKLERAVPVETAETMADILRGVVTHGTGRRAAVVPGACGKTGTTNDLRDAWFVGFTRNMVAAVWVGNDDYSPMGREVFGGTVCAPAWAEVMLKAESVIARARREARGSVEVARAEEQRRHHTTAEERRRLRREILHETTVFRVICEESGMLATARCPARRRQGFPRGTEPKESCAIHGSYTEEPGALESPDESSVGPEPAPNIGAADTHADDAEGRSGTASAARRSRERDRMEEVTICVQSQKRAGEHCPEVVTRTIPENRVPGKCTLHGPAARSDGSTQ